MKNKTLPVAVAVAIIGCVLAVSANVTTNDMHKNLNQERYKRMMAEEQLAQANQEIKNLGTELQETKAKIANIESVLKTGKSQTATLETRMQDLDSENAALRAQLESLKQPMPKMDQ